MEKETWRKISLVSMGLLILVMVNTFNDPPSLEKRIAILITLIPFLLIQIYIYFKYPKQ